MGRIIYSDGRTALTTTAFRYKLTDSAGTLVKDWTTGATWTEEPAGTYYLDDAAAVPGTRYAVEPATGEVGGVGMVPWGKPAATGDAMTLTAAYDKAKDDVLTPLAVVDGIVDGIAADYAKTGEAATAVATLHDFDPATDVVARVTLVDTTTTNTDMRGTDGAATATALALHDAKLDGVAANAQTAAGWDFGDDTCTLTIRDTAGVVLSDAQAYITDSGGHRSRTKTTDSLGQVKFDLTSGQSYNLWVTHDRYTGAVPVVFVASEDV